jgi:hypothetical protein
MDKYAFGGLDNLHKSQNFVKDRLENATNDVVEACFTEEAIELSLHRFVGIHDFPRIVFPQQHFFLHYHTVYLFEELNEAKASPMEIIA